MYKLIFERSYPDIEFPFDDWDEMQEFAATALDHALPDSEGSCLQVRIKKCAEGGNPEPAHSENQE